MEHQSVRSLGDHNSLSQNVVNSSLTASSAPPFQIGGGSNKSRSVVKRLRTFGRKKLQKILPYIFISIYFLLLKSWKFRFEAPEQVFSRYVKEGERKPCIFAFWHSDDLALLGFCSFRRLGILISRSNDGEVLSKILSKLGFTVIRGSSSNGGTQGLLGMINYLNDNGQVAVAVDGPRGPIYEVKPGVVELTRRSNRPIIPVRAFAEKAWFVPKSWNKTFLPKPFTTIRIVFQDPILPPDETPHYHERLKGTERYQQLIKQSLDDVEPVEQEIKRGTEAA